MILIVYNSGNRILFSTDYLGLGSTPLVIGNDFNLGSVSAKLYSWDTGVSTTCNPGVSLRREISEEIYGNKLNILHHVLTIL